MFLQSLFAAVTVLWAFVLLRLSDVPSNWALAIAVTLEVTTTVAIPFWWFNPTSYIAASLLLLSIFVCLHRPGSLFSWLSLSVSLALVLTSKPNGVIACLAIATLLLTRERGRASKVIAACAAATVLAFLICRFAQMPIAQIFQAYREIGKLRGSPLQLFAFREMGPLNRLVSLFMIFFTLRVFLDRLLAARRRQPGCWRQYLVCLAAALTSVEMICTNSEGKYSDLSVLVLATAMLCLCPWEGIEAKVEWKSAMVAVLAICAVPAMFFASVHARILGIGPGMFYESLPTVTVKQGFFRGLEAGPRLERAMKQTQEALAMAPSRTVFFGPRMEFEYAVFGKAPLRGMPLLWDFGDMFAREHFPSYLHALRQQDPDLLIFLKNDYTGMGLMATYIQSTPDYTRYDGFSELTVYIRRQAPGGGRRPPRPD